MALAFPPPPAAPVDADSFAPGQVIARPAWLAIVGNLNTALVEAGAGAPFISDSWADGQATIVELQATRLLDYTLPPAPSAWHTTLRVEAQGMGTLMLRDPGAGVAWTALALPIGGGRASVVMPATSQGVLEVDGIALELLGLQVEWVEPIGGAYPEGEGFCPETPVDGDRLFAFGGGTLRLWDLTSGRVLFLERDGRWSGCGNPEE